MTTLAKLESPPLFAHQREALERSRDAEAFALFHEMGLGKTLVLIETADHLAAIGKIDAALVVAPKGVYRNWTDSELPRWSRIAGARILAWSADQTAREDRALADAILRRDAFLWLAVNVEALHLERAGELLDSFLRTRAALVIVDEATTIKNPNAKRTETLLRVRHLAKYRRIASGTPITKSPLDLYAPCLWLSPSILGIQSWYAMRGRYCVTKPVYRKDPSTGKAVVVKGARQPAKVRGAPQYRHLDDLQAKLAPHSDRRTKAECLDLPPKVYQRREVELELEQARLYERMRSEARAELGAPGFKVTAPIVLTRMLRLHQIACGHLPRPDGAVERISNRRVEALLETLEEIDGKAIVWATYTADVHRVAEALREVYGPKSAAVYDGTTTADARPRIVSAFQNEAEPRFFVGQTRTGGYGLTLTAAQSMLYYSNTFDLTDRLQSEDRAHRIGQTGTLTVVDFVTPGTIDEKILEALRAKKNLADTVLGDEWREWI